MPNKVKIRNDVYLKDLIMRKIIIAFMFSILPLNVFASSQPSEVEEMGNLTGVVMACKAYRPLYQFEEILSRYYSNTSISPEEEKAKLRQYARAKANSFSLYRNRRIDCAEIISDFTRMPIFKSELYSDGSLRLPDGKFLYPRGQKKLANGAEKLYPIKRQSKQ